MKTICIDVSDDGAMSIGVEPAEEMEQEGMEGGMEGEMEEDKSYMEPVADERELMMRLRELIKPQEDPEAEGAFEAGFKQGGGMMGGMA